MTRHRDLHARRLPALLFAEGASEHGYGRWLGELARRHNIPVALRVEKLHGSDPFELVDRAMRKKSALRKMGKSYLRTAVLLDSDLLGQNPQRDAQARFLAADSGFHLIWQSPCHEAFLLRHFAGRNKDLPPTCKDAKDRLLKEWPGYRKGLNGIAYGDVLTSEHLARARAAEDGLSAFLDSLGWN